MWRNNSSPVLRRRQTAYKQRMGCHPYRRLRLWPRRNHEQEEGQETCRLGGGAKAYSQAGREDRQAYVRHFPLEAAEEGPKAMTIVYYSSGAPGATDIPLSVLYAMFVAVKRGQASIRFRDTSHRRCLFMDISYLDHRKTFGTIYHEEDFR